MDDGDLFIYFRLYVVHLFASAMSDTLATLPRKGEKVGCKENSRICAEKFPREVRILVITSYPRIELTDALS